MSGEILELWMLKVACGLFYSKNASKQRICLIDNHELNQQLMCNTLLYRFWGDGCGLYIKAPAGHVFDIENKIGMAPLTALNDKRIVGAGLIMNGITFMLFFDPLGVNPVHLANEGWVHRPSEIFCENERRCHSIGLTWSPGTPTRSVRMTVTKSIGRR